MGLSESLGEVVKHSFNGELHHGFLRGHSSFAVILLAVCKIESNSSGHSGQAVSSDTSDL